ncbi:AGAP012075-PA, partial [Anopheles gambiae str. PEST]
ILGRKKHTPEHKQAGCAVCVCFCFTSLFSWSGRTGRHATCQNLLACVCVCVCVCVCTCTL